MLSKTLHNQECEKNCKIYYDKLFQCNIHSGLQITYKQVVKCHPREMSTLYTTLHEKICTHIRK